MSNQIQKYIEETYLSIAIDAYIKFKSNTEHDEQYKYIVLEELHSKVKSQNVTEDNIVDFIKIYQKFNPQKGSFAHWNNLSDLLDFAKDRPEAVAQLINMLFDSSTSLKERIQKFYEEGKSYNRKLKLGTPLFGYLLAGYNYKEYPIYKDNVFNNFLDTIQFEDKPIEISDKYSLYYSLCHEVKDIMTDSEILDVQDFIYCLSQYTTLKANVAIHYVFNFAKKLADYKVNNAGFLEEISGADETYLMMQHNNYKNTEKINKIRYTILDKMINKEEMNLDIIQKIKETVNDEYEKNILNSWNDFTILFPLYYNRYKNKVRLEMTKIHEAIRTLDSFKGVSLLKDKVVNDFTWRQHFGSSDCWLAIYPTSKETHKKAAQLFVRISESEIIYGLTNGSELPADKDFESIKDIEKFSFGNLKTKMEAVFLKFLETNNENVVTEPIGGSSEDGKEDIIEGSIPEVDFTNQIHVESLYFPNSKIILQQVKTALKNGKHIIFTGPPGTGKSKLAKAICEQLRVRYDMVTATSDWSTYETIGGYRPLKNGELMFYPGVFLNAFKEKSSFLPINRWLIIDEINRADIDKAFGSLFSALTGDAITLPFQSESGNNILLRPQRKQELQVDGNDYEYIIPKDWRIIGTMNSLDKASLYEMSYAFMRRFAFIPISLPGTINETVVKHYFDIWDIEDTMNLSHLLAKTWNIINHYRKIGPALIEDIARYIEVDFDLTSAIALYVLPQFEGLMAEEVKEFIDQVSSLNEVNKEQLIIYAGDFS